MGTLYRVEVGIAAPKPELAALPRNRVRRGEGGVRASQDRPDASSEPEDEDRGLNLTGAFGWASQSLGMSSIHDGTGVVASVRAGAYSKRRGLPAQQDAPEIRTLPAHATEESLDRASCDRKSDATTPGFSREPQLLRRVETRIRRFHPPAASHPSRGSSSPCPPGRSSPHTHQRLPSRMARGVRSADANRGERGGPPARRPDAPRRVNVLPFVDRVRESQPARCSMNMPSCHRCATGRAGASLARFRRPPQPRPGLRAPRTAARSSPLPSAFLRCPGRGPCCPPPSGPNTPG